MSTIRDPAVITTAGRQMMTAGGDISYTKAVLYGQDISHLTKEQLAGLTSIGNPLLTVPVGISDKNDIGASTTVVLEATFQNSNLKADLPYTAVGFFAKRGDDAEKLVIVGVANPGAVLIATPPDGVATDALDIKVAIAIGDATNVTAVIDPAGSVTPATLNGAVNKLSNDLTAQIDTKANKTDVNTALDTKADKTQLPDLSPYAKTADVNSELDKKADKTALDDYAKSSDVAADVKQLSDSIATKANAKTVNDAIDKIDFSPYAKAVDVQAKLDTKANTTDLAAFAKSEDVSKQIEGVSTAVTNASNTEQADIDKITKALATKRDITDSYSKDELDKKFLQLSTDTGGKVDANQVATMIEKKADKSDVTKQIGAVTDLVNTKANSTDVDDAFSQRDNSINNLQGELDKQVNANWAIDNVNGQFNAVKTGYNVSDRSTQSFTTPGLNLLNSRATEIDQLKGRRTVNQPDFNALTDGGSYYITDPSNGKNAPTGSWGNLFVSNGNGHRISQLYFPDDGSAPFMRELDETTRHGWIQFATAEQINTVNSTLNTKANTSDVNSALNTKANTSDVSALQNKVNVDDNLYSAPGSVTSWASLQADGSKNVLRSVRTEGGGTDFNTGNYDAGILFGGNDTKALISVAYTGNRAIVTGGNNQSVWHEDIAWKSDVTNLQNQVNTKASVSDVNSLNQTISALQQTVQSLQNTVNQQATQITGLQTLVNNQANEIKQLQETTIKGKTFSKSQEAAAEAWEKQNSQQIAFILDN